MEINTKTHAETNIQSATISPLELYQQHVPKYLRQRLHHKISEGEKVSAESTQMFASVLFADISGFTQLSSRLSAEELQSHINEYFTKLLGIVDENAGDVVKFCGDAVLIMWAVPLTASEETKAAAVLMSALCALQMLEECGEYRRVRHSVHPNLQSPGSPTRTRLSMSRALSPAPAVPSPGSVPSYDSPLKSPSCSPQRAGLAGTLSPGLDVVELSLHCGISCGTVHGMVLGDNQRLEFILSGDVLSQMGEAEACAKAGEVCLHPAAYEKVSDKLRGEAVYPPKTAPNTQNFAGSAQPSHDHFLHMRDLVAAVKITWCVSLKKNKSLLCEKKASLRRESLDIHPAPIAGDKPSGEFASFCEEDRELAFAISDLVLSPPHSVACEDPISGRSAASGRLLPTVQCGEESKVPPPEPEFVQPVAYLLTGRLNESLELSLKRRSRSSLRCSTTHAAHTPIASTSSVSLLGRSDRERTGSVLSFGAASDRVSRAGLFVSIKWSPGEGPLPRSVSQDDATTAAEAEAQRQYALHELGLFPSNESAAELKPSVKSTLSVSTVQYLTSLAKEITGISSKPRLVRTKNRISAADVLPQANFSRKNNEVPSRASIRFEQRELCEEFGQASDEKRSFLGGQSGRNVSFRRKSLFGLFRSAKIRSESTDTAAGELKNDGGDESKRFCPPGEEKNVFSAGAGGEVSVKDSPSAVVGAGASSRFSSPLSASSRQGAHLSRKLQRQVTRNVSMLYANTRSSLGMFLSLSGSVLVQNNHTTSGYFSSTSAAAANDLENDYLRAVSSIDAAGVSQSPQNAHNSRSASENTPNWDSFGPPPVSSSASGDENEHVAALGCPSSASGEDLHFSLLSSLPHKVRKMPVARLKRKLKFTSDANIRAVRAYQDDWSSPANQVSTKKLEERSRKFISGSTRERNGVFGSHNVKNDGISGLNEAQAVLLQRELARFTHETAARAIDSNTVSFLSEMRDVAVVFMQILDLEQDFAAGLHHKPQRVLCVILKLLRQFGGSLRQFVVDDKGCVAIACFGLSGSSNENNCLQAVEFAVTTRTLLHTLGCRTASGITLGRVYCGLVGAWGRCEYAVMGSSVNLAARLMAACAAAMAHPAAPPHSSSVGAFSSSVPASHTRSSIAPGGVFVDAAVHDLAHHQFHFEEHTHIAAKGYSEPVPVFVAVRKKPTTRPVPTHTESKQACEGERRREEPLHVKDRHILRRDVDLTLSEKVKSTIRASNHASSSSLSSSKLPLLERDGLVQEVLDSLVSDRWIPHTGRSNVRTFSGGSQKSRDSVLSGVQTRPKAVLERCVLIEGPAGVGRSSLLAQVLHHLATMGPELPYMPHTDLRVAPREVKIAAVVCDPANQYVPYDLVRALLCKVIGIYVTGTVSEGLFSTTECAKTDKTDPEGENSPCFGANESNDLGSSPQRPAQRQSPLSEEHCKFFTAEKSDEGLRSDNSTIWTKMALSCVCTTNTSSSTSSAASAPLEALLETWCGQHVPLSLSLGAAFALCHPGAHLFEVLLFHDKQAPSSERNFSAAEENPQHASTVAALCETPLVCFLPLLNDLFGMNLPFGSADLGENVPFEAIVEDFLSPVLSELLVDVLLQVLLMCVMGHQSLLMEAATPRGCDVAGRDLKSPNTPHVCVLAVDDLQHADAESLNLICKVLSGAVRLDTTQSASSACFIATHCDTSAALSSIVTSATLTGASAASFSVTRPLRRSIALHTETCASVGDLFSSTNVQQESFSHHKLMKIIRKQATLIAVPRLSKQAVRALMCHTLGPELWAWVLNNASLVLGTGTQSANIKHSSPLSPSRSTNSPTDDRRAAALALLLSSRQSSGSLMISSPHAAQNTYTMYTTDSAPSTSVRPRRSSFHVPTAATAASASAVPDRACFTTDGAAGIAMTEASAASVTTGQVRQGLIRRPRGQTEESKVVSLVYTLAQNGLPRGVIEICASLRHAIDTNTFSGLYNLPVVVKRNKLLLEVLDHLSGVEVVVLKAAAVIGGSFDIAALVVVLAGMGMLQCTQENVLGGVLGRLVSVGLVRCVRDSECGVRCDSHFGVHSAHSAAHIEHSAVYQFTESTTQLAIYNLMMETQRAVAHGAMGAHLEALYDSTYNDHSTYSDKSTYGTYNPDCCQSTHTTQSTRTTQSSTTINRPHHYTPTQLQHITHHYRHSDSAHKKVEYLLYCAQHYTSIHYYTSAIALYNELITLALGMCMDDVVSICRENEISAVAVLQMLTIPYTPAVDGNVDNVSVTSTGIHSSTGVIGTSVIDVAALRQQLFVNQVAVLDVNMLRQKKKVSARNGGWWWRWLHGTSNTSDDANAHIAAGGGTNNTHTAHHATTTNTTTRAKPQPASSCLVSSLAQDTAHALHYQHCAQQLAPLSLSELLVQRRVLLRVLAAHRDGSGSNNALCTYVKSTGSVGCANIISNVYAPLTSLPVLILRTEVAACGVNLSRVAKWASYVAELHNRCDEEEDGVEYAALALHLTDLSAIPSVTTSTPTPHGTAPSTTSAGKYTRDGKNSVHKLWATQRSNKTSSDKSTNSTNSTNSSNSVYTTSIPDASVNSVHNSGSSVESSSNAVLKSVDDVPSQSHVHEPVTDTALASDVCCGWWFCGTSHAKVAVAPPPRVPPLVLPAIEPTPVTNIASAVDNVLFPLYPAPPRAQYRKRSNTNYCTLHALLQPVHATCTTTYVHNDVLVVANSCVNRADVGV